jgi:hypothetical protein
MTFHPGDLIAYPREWQHERRYKVLRRHAPTRHGAVCYDLLDVELGLVFKRIWLRGCVLVAEDCSRRLAS